MKRYFLIIFALFLTIGFVGCNRDGSDLKIDMDEFIANPTNLSIDGTTLSWDAVDNADGYIVYANDEEADKVNGTSFNFSGLDGDVIIFQVRTRAPRGMQDSALSVSIAYVENRASEIEAVEAAIRDSGTIFVETGFGEELVNKGITSQDINDMIDAYEEYLGTFSNSNSEIDDYIMSLRSLFDAFDNIEAIVSAIVKIELPNQISYEILKINSDIALYEGMNDPTKAVTISELEQERDMYQDILDEINDNPDDMILGITSTIEYFVSINDLVDDNLIDLAVGLTETENPVDLNVSELKSVKEETVAVLRDTMPSEEDVVMAIDVLILFNKILGTDITNNDIDNYRLKMAAQTMYSLELFINFLDSFDNSFFNDLEDELNSSDSEESKMTEMIILIVEVFDRFYDDNQNLMDTIDEVFTEEENEILYDNNISLITNQYYNYGLDFSGLDKMSFSDVLKLRELLDDSFDVLLDSVIDNDCEVIRQYAVNLNFNNSTYSNDLTRETFDSYDEYSLNVTLSGFDFYNELLIVLNDVLQSLEEEDANTLLIYLANTLFVSYENQINSYVDAGYSISITQSELDDIYDVIILAIADADSSTLEFLQNFTKYIIRNDVFDDLKDLEVEFNENNVQYDEQNYAHIILLAGYYDDFMTSSNRDLIEVVLGVVIDTLSNQDVSSVTGHTSTYIDGVENTVIGLLDLFDEDLTSIKNYDYSNLSQAEEEAIEDFLLDLHAVLYNTY